MRGFTREVLSLVAWGASAFAAYFAIKQQPCSISMPYVDKPILRRLPWAPLPSSSRSSSCR
jgi:hypothetical protein